MVKHALPPLNEDSVLLQGVSGLPYIEERNDQVIFFNYSVALKDNEDSDSDEIDDWAYHLQPLHGFYENNAVDISKVHFPAILGSKALHSQLDRSNSGLDSRTPPVQGDCEEIHIMDFKGCNLEVAAATISARTKQSASFPGMVDLGSGYPGSPGPSGGSNGVAPEPPKFITGISLRSSHVPPQPGNPTFLQLFASIPYLGLKRQRQPTGAGSQPDQKCAGSRSLRQYRLQDITDQDPDLRNQVLVHQTWFVLFDNVNIALFRSEDDYDMLERASLYPYQERNGAFRVFVNMIANTITSSEDEALQVFRKQVASKETDIHQRIKEEAMLAKKYHDEKDKWEEKDRRKKKDIKTKTEDERKQLEKERLVGVENEKKNRRKKRADINNVRRAKEALINDFEDLVLDLSVMVEVVRLQIRYLRQLEKIFQNSFEAEVESKVKARQDKTRPHKNAFEIPYICDNKEQISCVLDTLACVMSERENPLRDLEDWEKELKFTRKLLLQRSAKQEAVMHADMHNEQGEAAAEQTEKLQEAMAKNAVEQTAALQQTLGEQLKNATELKKSVARQGQTITMFTLITTIFLPLGFFCAYVGMSPSGSEVTIRGQRHFWAVAGPVTLTVFLFLMLFVFTPDDKLKAPFGKLRKKYGSKVSPPSVNPPSVNPPNTNPPSVNPPSVSPTSPSPINSNTAIPNTANPNPGAGTFARGPNQLFLNTNKAQTSEGQSLSLEIQLKSSEGQPPGREDRTQIPANSNQTKYLECRPQNTRSQDSGTIRWTTNLLSGKERRQAQDLESGVGDGSMSGVSHRFYYVCSEPNTSVSYHHTPAPTPVG